MNRTTNMKPAAILLLFSATLPAATEDRPPNIIFVLADDLGWSELGCYGNEFHDTPSLDRMARQGMRFTQAYAAAPVCSPYRAAFLTGMHPARTGILDYLRPNSANALSTQYSSLASELKQAGYTTGMIGKWHLTGYDYHDAEHEIKPRQHGFDWDFGREVKGVGNGANFWPYVFRTQPIQWLDIPNQRLGEKEYLTDRLNLEAVDFIERNQKRPFFLYLSHFAPHSILNGRPDLVQKYRDRHPPGPSSRERCYLCQDQGHQGDPLNHWAGDHNPHLAAMLESIDGGVGKILNTLKRLQLENDTIVIFSSDNGGETNVTSNHPLRGGKSQLYEGGIRVPLIIRWPGRVAEGAVCNAPVVNTDFLPTLLKAAGCPAPAVSDGTDISSLFADPDGALSRTDLFWHYPLDRPHFLGGVSGGAIRSGSWKLIEFFDDGHRELYSLETDTGESKDLAEQHPEVVDALQAKLTAWRNGIHATVPSAPLISQPGQLYFADHFSPLQVSERWHFNGDWSAVDGRLQRGKSASESTRIFVKKPEYKDVLIRFDFQLQESQDIRMITGSSGHYNTVLHIRPDHFYLQTAKDDRGPWFSYRHAECACEFHPDRWYTMTVEFSGNRVVAHLDKTHLVAAEHPIVDQQRTYFAFQVDSHTAAFDNVQILTARPLKTAGEAWSQISNAVGKFPVDRPAEEQKNIDRSNAHEWLYQNDPKYKSLVTTVDDLDAKRKEQFPAVYRSHKDFQKQMQKERKHLLATDADFKARTHATHKAKRAIEQYLISLEPAVADQPDHLRKRRIAELALAKKDSTELKRLQAAHKAAVVHIESGWPHLFRTNEQVSAIRRQNREQLKASGEFKQAEQTRAAAWRAKEDYIDHWLKKQASE